MIEQKKSVPGRRDLGAALIMSMIVTILVMGFGAAFFILTQARGQLQYSFIQSDETQVICDAVLEKARYALYQYRLNAKGDPLAWDEVLSYCRTLDLKYGGALKADFTLDPQGAVVYEKNQSFTTDSSGNIMELVMLDNAQRIKEDSLAKLKATGSAFTDYNDDAKGANTTGAWEGDFLQLFAQSLPYGKGSFHLSFRDNDDGDSDPLSDSDQRAIITVTATLHSGMQRQIEIFVEYKTSEFDPDAAILSKGTVEISGNPTVKGLKGSVHSNAHLTVGGSATVEQNATSSGFSYLKTSSIGGTRGGQQPNKEIPVIDPENYRSYADFVLTDKGQVFDKSGKLIYTSPNSPLAPRGRAVSPSEFNSFKYTGSSGWDLSSNTAPAPATYFFQDNLKISGNPGENGTPAKMTIITTANLDISGNPSIVPYLESVSGIAGGDLSISGNPSTGQTNYQGLFAAHEQVKINGNPSIAGAVIAEDAVDASRSVQRSNVTFTPDEIGAPEKIMTQGGVVVSGNPTITFNGGLKTMISQPGSVPIISQRRLK